MRPLALIGLLSCLLQGILAVSDPSPTPPTSVGKKKRPLTELDKILRIFTPNPPPAIQEEIPDDFKPSVNYTKRGDYPPYVEIATAFVEEKNPGINFDLANGYYIDPEGEAHVYFPQIHNGLDIANAAAQVSVVSLRETQVLCFFILFWLEAPQPCHNIAAYFSRLREETMMLILVLVAQVQQSGLRE